MLFLTVLLIKYDQFMYVFLDTELKYRLCKLQSNLTNFSVIFDCITPLCEMPSLSTDYGGKHIPIIQGSLAQNFNGHEKMP